MDLLEPVAITAALANCRPRDALGGCSLCSPGIAIMDPDDPANHAQACPWKRASDYVAWLASLEQRQAHPFRYRPSDGLCAVCGNVAGADLHNPQRYEAPRTGGGPCWGAACDHISHQQVGHPGLHHGVHHGTG